MSAADLADDDLSLAALLFDAGKQDLVPTEAVMDVLLEALRSGRAIEEVVDDRDVLSRRQRESLQKFVQQQSARSLPRRSTVAGLSDDTGPDRDADRRQTNTTSTPDDQFAADCRQHLPTGFDRYDPEQEIGRGGWGVVWQAQDLQLNRTVAVKKMIDDGRTDADSVRRFLHEARITAQLQHPGIVPVYERGLSLDDRQPFYSMKLLQGTTLRDRIRDYHRMTDGAERRAYFDRLLRSFVDVCDAVGFAHSRNVIHRDLKPSNVVVGEFGETVVVDWGLATELKPASGDDSAQLPDETLAAGTPREPVMSPRAKQLDGLLETAVTRDGTVIGTPAFMSPEQASGKSDIDQRSDVYALGSMLYVLLTGQPPFHEDSVEATLVAVGEGKFQPPRSINRQIPRALASICCKAMSKQPVERYPSAVEVGDDLRNFLANERVVAHHDSTLEKFARWCRRRPVLAVGLIVGTTLTAVLTSSAAVLIADAQQAEAKARATAETALVAEAKARGEAEAAQLAATSRLRDARQAADEWLIGLSGTLEHYPGLESVRHDLLQQATRHYQSLLESTDPPHTDELELVRNRLRLADLLLLQGHPEEARQQFAQALQSDFETVSNVEAATERINACIGLTLCDLRDGRPDEERTEQLRDLLSVCPLAEHPDAVELLNSVARAHLVLARGRIVEREYDSATESFAAALEFAERFNSIHSTERSQRLLKTIRTELAATLSALQRHDAAADVLKSQIDDVDQSLADQTKRPDLLETRALTRMRWANEQQQLGEIWAAEGAYRLAVTDLSDAWDLLFGDRFYNENLAIAQANLGQLSLRLNRPDDAEPMLRAAVDQLTGVLQSGIGDRETASRLAACNVSLGEVLLLKGNPAAEEQMQRSLEIFEYLSEHDQMSDQDRGNEARATRNLGRYYLLTEQYQQAAVRLQAATVLLQHSAAKAQPEQRLLIETELDLADAQQHLQQGAEADQQRAAALQNLTTLAETESIEEAKRDGSATLRLIELQLQPDGNASSLEEARRRLNRLLPAGHSSAAVQQLQAIAEWKDQRFEAARASLHTAISLRRFPDAVDQALEGCILCGLGQSEAAAARLQLVEEAVRRQPGRVQLKRWAAALAHSLQSDPASGKSVPEP